MNLNQVIEAASEMWADKDYTAFATFTARRMDHELQYCMAADVLRYSALPVAKPNAVYSLSPTRTAINLNAGEISPLQMCARPAFEIGKPLDAKRYAGLLTCIRVGIDRLFYRLVYQYSTAVKGGTAVSVLDGVNQAFGGERVYRIYAGSSFKSTEFADAARLVPNVYLESAEPTDRVLDDNSAIFIRDQKVRSYGSIYVGGVVNGIPEGLDPERFPPIRVHDAPNKPFLGEQWGPYIDFGFVTPVLLSIDDPLAFIHGKIIEPEPKQ
jgi:hypothetical protein